MIEDCFDSRKSRQLILVVSMDSIIEKNTSSTQDKTTFSDTTLDHSPSIMRMMWSLSQYTSRINKIPQKLDSPSLCNTLHEIASIGLSESAMLRVKDKNADVANDRMIAFQLIQIVLKDGLRLFGLDVVFFM